jgi:hypothetical protein
MTSNDNHFSTLKGEFVFNLPLFSPAISYLFYNIAYFSFEGEI